MSTDQAQPKLHGGHILAIFIGSFAVIIGVNILMATLAVQTFPGLWANNGYVASQNYNRLLKDAATQADLKWKSDIAIEGALVTIRLSNGSNVSTHGLSLQAIAGRPASELEDTPLQFAEYANGYRTTTPLPPGRWVLDMEARRGDELVWRDTRAIIIEEGPSQR